MLIGLSGRAGSGKDTAYGYVKEWADASGIPCRRVGFADKLKVSAARALGFQGTKEECLGFCDRLKNGSEIAVFSEGESYCSPGYTLSGRQYLQHYGTEAHREVFGDSFWVDAALGEIDSRHEVVVVTDVRFQNEAEAIRDRGGEVWLVDRLGKRITESAHASEQALPLNWINWIITNNGSLDTLRDRVQSAMDLKYIRASR